MSLPRWRGGQLNFGLSEIEVEFISRFQRVVALRYPGLSLNSAAVIRLAIHRMMRELDWQPWQDREGYPYKPGCRPSTGHPPQIGVPDKGDRLLEWVRDHFDRAAKGHFPSGGECEIPEGMPIQKEAHADTV